MLFLVLILILIISPVAVFAGSVAEREDIELKEITLYYNGIQLEQKGYRVIKTDVLPGVDYDCGVYVPIRTFEAMNAYTYMVFWYEIEGTGIATLAMTDKSKGVRGHVFVQFGIGSELAATSYPFSSDSELAFPRPYRMEFAAFLHEGSTMIPSSSAWMRDDLFAYESSYYYQKDKLGFFDHIEGANYNHLYKVGGNNINKEEWVSIKHLNHAEEALLSVDDGEWSLSIVKEQDGEKTELIHLLGENFAKIRRANEDTQMDCNGVEIKRISGQYFLNKADLIEIGFIEADWK